MRIKGFTAAGYSVSVCDADKGDTVFTRAFVRLALGMDSRGACGVKRIIYKQRARVSTFKFRDRHSEMDGQD